MTTRRSPAPPKSDHLFGNLRYDLPAGFLVFLIALPLCIGISKASDWPAMAGIFTAIVGGIVASALSNSELTIKGPAAGLIVIALGCITEFKAQAGGFGYEDDPGLGAYKLALGVCVASGILQILFGLFRAGILVELFPLAAVHGMLAAIGIIIFSKQAHTLMGVTPVAKEPLELLREIPHSFMHMNPVVFLIGLASLIVLFGIPLVRNPWVRRLPAPMLVMAITIPMGLMLGLKAGHEYHYFDHLISVGPEYLVKLPASLLDSITTPDFRGLKTMTGAKYVLMFALIGSLESLLSSKAIDLLDPWQRKTNFNRDLLAVGVANTVVGFLGGLPMISEIVRSSANINNGARTRLANVMHGACLLGFVALAPGLIQLIPNAALAAMLVYTGFRLASPKEFIGTYRIGREQLLIFVVTIVVTLATDLLVGIAAGIATKLFLHYLNGVMPSNFLRLRAEVIHQESENIIRLRDAVIFSNWLPFLRLIEEHGLQANKNLMVDVYETKLIDHNVVEKLHQLEDDFERRSLKLRLVGLEGHRRLSSHPMAAIKRGLQSVQRITIYADDRAESEIIGKFRQFGVTGYTSVPVSGAGRNDMAQDPFKNKVCVRIEVLAAEETGERILDFLYRRVIPRFAVTACVERVMVMRADDFAEQVFAGESPENRSADQSKERVGVAH